VVEFHPVKVLIDILLVFLCLDEDNSTLDVAFHHSPIIIYPKTSLLSNHVTNVGCALLGN